MEDKKTLRRRFSGIRKAAHSEKAEALIAERLLSLDRVRNAGTILLYASFGSEINTWETAGRLLSEGKTVAFPLCGKDGAMTFHTVSSLSELTAGSYGISEPDISLPQPDVTRDTVCIVPGLAFTADGGRLGYGGGYYDRFLAAHPEVFTIAPADEAMITDSLPMLGHDLRINMIVTEERTVLCLE